MMSPHKPQAPLEVPEQNGEAELMPLRIARIPSWMVVLSLLPLAITIFSVVWWAQSVERRLAVLERDASSAEAADQAFRHENEMITQRRDAQMARMEDHSNRIEDRLNDHIQDDINARRELLRRQGR